MLHCVSKVSQHEGGETLRLDNLVNAVMQDPGYLKNCSVQTSVQYPGRTHFVNLTAEVATLAQSTSFRRFFSFDCVNKLYCIRSLCCCCCVDGGLK